MATKIGRERAEFRRLGGPVRHELDEDKMFELASIGMNVTQIADWFGINAGKLNQNDDWLDIIREGRAQFAESIISKQYQIAMTDGHKQQGQMLLHLGKVSLGQREPTEQKIEISAADTFLKLIEQSQQPQQSQD